MQTKPPALASKPVYEPAPQAVRFEFWKGEVRQAGSFKIPNMTAETALDYFMMNWDRIGLVALRTPPTDGVVRLQFAGPRYQLMPGKPFDLPMDVAKAFVKDMREFFAAGGTGVRADEIAARQLHALRAYQRPHEKKLKLTDVKEMFVQMRDHA
jgi:hypothetical protein